MKLEVINCSHDYRQAYQSGPKMLPFSQQRDREREKCMNFYDDEEQKGCFFGRDSIDHQCVLIHPAA